MKDIKLKTVKDASSSFYFTVSQAYRSYMFKPLTNESSPMTLTHWNFMYVVIDIVNN